MASKEIIETVALAIVSSLYNDPFTERQMVDGRIEAEAAISVILSALQCPTEGMFVAADGLDVYGLGFVWRAMLNSSPLGEQSE